MGVVIDLTPHMEQRLKDWATESELEPQEYARLLVETGLDGPGAELVEYWQRSGVIGAWKDRTDITDSTEYGRQLRKRAEKRQHEECGFLTPTS